MPSWPEPSWRRLAGFSCLLALLLLTPPRTACGQTNETPPTPSSSEASTPLQLTARLHVQQLIERKSEMERLNADSARLIEDLRTSCQSAQDSAANLFQDLTETSAQLLRLQTASMNSRLESENYRAVTDRQVADLQVDRDAAEVKAERRGWLAVAFGILFSVFAALTGAHIVGWW